MKYNTKEQVLVKRKYLIAACTQHFLGYEPTAGILKESKIELFSIDDLRTLRKHISDKWDKQSEVETLEIFEKSAELQEDGKRMCRTIKVKKEYLIVVDDPYWKDCLQKSYKTTFTLTEYLNFRKSMWKGEREWYNSGYDSILGTQLIFNQAFKLQEVDKTKRYER